jgi:hypothetical protein
VGPASALCAIALLAAPAGATGEAVMSFYDLTANKKADLSFPFPVSRTFFTPDSKKLLLLTNDQVVYTVDPVLTK